MSPRSVPPHLYQLLFETIDDAVLLTVPDGAIRAANPSACKMFGMTEAEICAAGRAFFLDESSPAVQRALEQRSATGTASFRYTFTKKDGSKLVGDVRSVIAEGGASAFVIIRDITPVALAEEAAAASLQRLVAALEGACAGIWEFDLEAGENTWAEGMPELFGISQEDAAAMAHRWTDLVHPDDRGDVLSHLADFCRRGDREYLNQFRVIRSDGAVRWVLSRATVVTRAGRQRLIGISYDITAAKKVQEALQESERQLAVALESADLGTFEIEAESGKILWDSRTREIFGVALDEEPTLALCRSRIAAEDWGAVEAALARAFDPCGDGTYKVEFRVVPPNGKQAWVMAMGRVAATAGRPGRLCGVNMVVTDRKEAEEALRQSEEKFRIMGEILPYGVWLCDAAGKAEYVSLSFLELLNMSQEEQKGFEWSKRLVPEDVPGMMEKWLHCITTGEEWDSEHRIIDRHGDIKTILTRGRPVRDNTGEITAWAGVNLDITARKRAEAELRSANERAAFFSSALENSSQPFAAGYPDGRLKMFNKAFMDLTGYSEEELRSATWAADLTPPEWREHESGILEELHRTGEPQLYQKEYLRKDGRHIPIELKVHLASDAEGTYHYSFLTDITDRKLAEEELQESSRRKDAFLAMLSHELRNPLAPIRNSLYLLRNGDLCTGEMNYAYEVIDRQSEQLARLVDDLLDVARISRGKVELQKVPLDLGEVVNAVVADHRRLMQQRGIKLLGPDPLQPKAVVVADRARLTQVLGNLLHNAAKFTPSGGTVTVQMVLSKGEASVSVVDTGRGISSDLLQTIFDKFVQGQHQICRSEGGLGLGLALVKGLMEMHDGRVEAASAGEGHGSTFTVTLPLSAKQVAVQCHEQHKVRHIKRHILIVDDNRDSTDSLTSIMKHLGHEVEIAYDGPSAIAAIEKNPPEVMLCDVGLPGMSGYRVAQSVRNRYGNRVLLVAITGYARAEDIIEALNAGFDHHLSKPVDLKHLIKLLSTD